MKKSKIWNPEMDKVLIDNYKTVNNRRLGEMLSVKGIRSRLKVLGLVRTSDEISKLESAANNLKRIKLLKWIWTPELDQFLIDNYKTLLNRELMEKIKFPIATIGKRMDFLGLSRTDEEVKFLQNKSYEITSAHVFTKKEIEYLKKNWNKKTHEELAKEFGVRRERITKIFSNLKFKNYTPIKKEWTPEMIDFLKNNYKKLENSVLSKKLGLGGKHTVKRKLKELNLKRTKDEQLYIIKNLVPKAVAKIENKEKRLLVKWENLNGEVPANKILVFIRGGLRTVDNLKLIKKIDYRSFIKKRNIEAKKEKIRQEKQKQQNLNHKIISQRRIKEEKQEKKRKMILDNYKQKSLEEISVEQMAMDKVPVMLDTKTTIYVKRDKCINVNGRWIKK